MDKPTIAVATMTLIRDAGEENLLRESLSLLAQQEIKTFVADGDSNEEFIEFLQSFPNFQVDIASSYGVFQQVKRSLRAAADSEVDFIQYTEPDKKLFLGEKLHRFISNATLDENVGIVLASRSAESFATFPAFQQYTETVINNLCAEIIEKQGDYTYGPFLFNRKLAAYLDSAPDELGWGWRPYLFGAAAREGFDIVHLTGDYPCPVEQRKEEDNPAERIYRMKQLSQNIDGIILSTKTDLLNVR